MESTWKKGKESFNIDDIKNEVIIINYYYSIFWTCFVEFFDAS